MKDGDDKYPGFGFVKMNKSERITDDEIKRMRNGEISGSEVLRQKVMQIANSLKKAGPGDSKRVSQELFGLLPFLKCEDLNDYISTIVYALYRIGTIGLKEKTKYSDVQITVIYWILHKVDDYVYIMGEASYFALMELLENAGIKYEEAMEF